MFPGMSEVRADLSPATISCHLGAPARKRPGFLHPHGPPDIWTQPTFQAAQGGGLNWALDRVAADSSPDVARAAPQAPCSAGRRRTAAV